MHIQCMHNCRPMSAVSVYVVTINSRFLHHSCIIMSAYTHAECLKCMSLCTPTSLRALRIFFEKNTISCMGTKWSECTKRDDRTSDIHSSDIYVYTVWHNQWMTHTHSIHEVRHFARCIYLWRVWMECFTQRIEYIHTCTHEWHSFPWW